MRLAFAITGLCALLSSLTIDQVSASPGGAVRRAVPRDKVRLNRQNAPTSRLHERGWQGGHWGWGGWGWGQRDSPILAEYPGYAPLPSLDDILQHNNSYARRADRRADNGTFLPLDNIQGDIFVGMRKPVELFYFFQINDAASFKSALRNNVITLVTSTSVLIASAKKQPLAFMNIAFSQRGLNALGITDNLGDSFFSAGQLADASQLGDNVAGTWDPAFTGSGIHGVLLISSDRQRNVDRMLRDVLSFFGSSISETTRLQGTARPGSEAGHEHFGYLDGVSNPAIAGFNTKVLPGQSAIPAGIILTGRPGDTTVRPSWAVDGSFLVFRKLQQFVPEFNKFTVANAVQNPQGTLSRARGAELFGARMVGRWKSGAPIDLTPLNDDPGLGADPNRNNNFDFSHPGFLLASDQSHCPFAAHIRKTRPRADLGNTNVLNQAIRAGIPYGPEVNFREMRAGATRQDRGLAFVEYQSHIGNGFRFQQRSWANNPNFPFGKTQTVGLDSVIGQAGNNAPRTTFGINPFNTTRSYSLPEFITPRGGEYFFSPSITALKSTIAA